MKNIPANSLGFCLLLFIALGCNLSRLAKLNTNFLEGGAASEAARAVREKIGKPFKVTQIIITSNEFTLQAQDPNNPRNLDEYQYVGGFVAGPKPVQLNAMNDNLEQSAFPFDEINFAAVPTIVRESVAKAGIENGRVTQMLFQRGFALTDSGAGALGTPRWLIEIKGARETVTATADPKGNLIGVDLSRTSQAADYSVFKNGELQKAQDAFKNAFGANVKAESVTIYDKYVVISTPNAENAKKINRYKFDVNGLSRGDFLPSNARPGNFYENFSLAEVDLSNAASFVEKAKTRLNLPNAKLDFISVERRRMIPDTVFKTIWRVRLKSGANEGSVEYDAGGAEIRVSKD